VLAAVVCAKTGEESPSNHAQDRADTETKSGDVKNRMDRVKPEAPVSFWLSTNELLIDAKLGVEVADRVPALVGSLTYVAQIT
jgi:hypothetical protein